MSIGCRVLPNTEESPFIRCRDILVEGRHGSAYALRGLVLELCEGKPNLYARGIGGYDNRHTTLLVEITWWIGELGAEAPGLQAVLKVAWADWEFAQERLNNEQ